MRGRIGWYLLQIAIVGGVVWLFLTQVNPSMQGLTQPVQPHVAVIIGIGVALLVTVAIVAVADFVRRRRLPRR